MSTMHRPSFTKTLTALLPGGILPHLLLLCSVIATFPALAQAANFAGDLDQVKITDAAGTNQPPVAAFTFTQNGETYTFDASGSSDPDGSIATYKWTFSDGTTKEGTTTNYTYSGSNSFDVTLAVIDTGGGATILRKSLDPTPTCSGEFGPAPTSPSSQDTTGNLLILTKVSLTCKGTLATMSANLYAANTATRSVKYLIFDDDNGAPGKILYVSSSQQGTGNNTYSIHSLSTPVSSGDYWVGIAENPADAWWPRLNYSAGSSSYITKKLSQVEYDNLAVSTLYSNLTTYTSSSGSNRDYGLKISF